MSFSNLEYISIENQTTEFPKHFHETFCISLIHKGTERIDFENQSLFSESGSISITNPYEIHSNPLIDRSSYLKFDTIYVPNELMKQALDDKNIKFINGNRKIRSKKLNALFLELKNALGLKHMKAIEYHFIEFVKVLEKYSEEDKNEYSNLDFDKFNEVNTYIENHIQEKFCLDELSGIVNINKYGFAKKFRAITGMTPINYILMRKVFSCKKLIRSGVKLTDIAYQYNFTDMAHFSKTFKRFIGISPKEYKESTL